VREVIVTYDVFKVICEYSSQFASYKMPRDKWVECLGYLFAKVPSKADTQYIVQEAIGMTSGTEMRVEMPPDEFAQIERLLNERPGMFLGGWWHTHPGLSPFFSETDLDNQTFYQQGNEDGLGIVFDFSLIDDTFIGFKIYRLKTKNSRQYDDVQYKLVGFTEEKLRKVLDNFSGITNTTVHNLAIHYGFATGTFSKLPDIEIPPTSDPVEDGHRNFSRAKVYLVQKKWDECFKTLRIAAELFTKGKKYDLAIDTYLDIAKNSITTANTAWAYDSFKRIDGILELGEKEKGLDGINYYKGKRHASEALIRAKEGNLCLAAFHMQNIRSC
jgi:proteasome lid subunit RPN8/RPN11